MFAEVMGMIADVWVQKHQRKQARRDVAGEFGRMRRETFAKMSNPDFGFVPAELRTSPLGEERKVVTWGNYLEFRLRQLRLVDRKLLDAMAMTFARMDTQSRGYIELDDIEQSIMIESETFDELVPMEATVSDTGLILCRTRADPLILWQGDQTPRIFTRAPADFDIETPRNKPANRPSSLGPLHGSNPDTAGAWATPRGNPAQTKEPFSPRAMEEYETARSPRRSPRSTAAAPTAAP